MHQTANLEESYRTIEESAIKDWETFLRFESISSEKEKESDMLKTADWLSDYLNKIGFTTSILKTEGHPAVFAENKEAGPSKPTVLIYGHYDVQPTDPLELWKNPPFQPTIVGKTMYARGAQDNKGQIFYCIQAMRALKLSGPLPVNIKFLIEGEEETGSPSLPKLLDEKKDLFKSDYFIVADCGIPDMEHPAIALSLRGILSMDVHFRGSKGDLHSGMHGGLAFNPNHALIQALSALRGKDGKILVPGFYDDVVPPSASITKEIFSGLAEQEYLATVGCLPTGGERGLSMLERGSLRPTLEVNGIHGGYAGSGFKTVIPAEAVAKVSCRLVPNQDPHKIASSVRNFLLSNCPEGIEIHVDIHKGVGEPVRADSNSPIVQAVKKGYEEVFKKPCRYIMEGASIPIVAKMKSTISKEFVLMGLGMPSDAIHAPNEHFGLDRFKMGALIIAKTLSHLGNSSHN
ncbi:dipeptidase [Estrella lausannensis]|uniref:Peptidase n=1 Tax=Estrella lausannensis TaxID=483423 RepID=A0A0H5E761_9BACT|nr:dipeptidase [Estrella lausannensis]CRX39155.1 Peptidase [Estrella lausannensis]